MLKIKNNIELKELEKYGFKKEEEDYYYDFVPYDENDNSNSSYVCIGHFGNIVSFGCVQSEDFNKAIDLIYDLIQDGLVEKVK